MSYKRTRVWKCAHKDCGAIHVRKRFEPVVLDCPTCKREDTMFPALDGGWTAAQTDHRHSVQLDLMDDML